MRESRGFSLIEVLVVIVLVGVLSGIAITQYASFRTRGYESQVEAVVRGVATGEEAHFANHRVYAASVAELRNVAVGEVAITISPGNSGSLATSFRVVGAHAGTPRIFTWVSDPAPGEPNLFAN